MNRSRAFLHETNINQTRREKILKLLSTGPKTAFKISCLMPEEYIASATVLCRLRELQAAGQVHRIGDFWSIKS
ncbi:hypothetical protein QUB05_21065 [Microcoleus sp. F10-C6]|uniref:hypothetical protein n=1 Tax=unclassified Microcoleus TaxID=2642155 RepID=UPI002FD0328A